MTDTGKFEEIKTQAYYNWINRGRPHGGDVHDWKAAYEYVVHDDPSLLAKRPDQTHQPEESAMAVPATPGVARQLQAVGRVLRKKAKK